jgi:hypothetical protein
MKLLKWKAKIQKIEVYFSENKAKLLYNLPEISPAAPVEQRQRLLILLPI